MKTDSDSFSFPGSACSNKARYQAVAHDLLHSELANGHSTIFSVAGDCMDPVLQYGDSITVNNSGRYFPGDIVVFSDTARGQVAHRFLGGFRINGRQKYLISSDHAERPDPLIEASRILGKVIGVNRSPVSISISKRVSSVIRFVYWTIRIGFTKRVLGRF